MVHLTLLAQIQGLHEFQIFLDNEFAGVANDSTRAAGVANDSTRAAGVASPTSSRPSTAKPTWWG